MDNPDSVESLEVVKSNPDFFLDWVSRHGIAVHGYLQRRVGRQVADDLLGEVWMQSFKSRTSFDRDHYVNALPWLYGVTRNVLRAHWRAAERVQPQYEAAISDPWPDVDAHLDARSRRSDLELALAMLTDDEREVLLLVAWEHLNPAEIARLLDLPQGTVRSRLHRARTIMRGQMDAEASFSEER